MNITDVDDKIIKRVHETGAGLREFTARFEEAFFEDLKTLQCRTPHATPRATEHIGRIIELIGQLMARGLAYQTPDGSVWFSIEKYRASGHQYGQLVKLNFDEMRVGERVQSDEYAKEAVADFALWKARAPEDGMVFWPSPWGEGRPGWHIECSAMSTELLGPSFDLHLGGEDLMFPHHEDEIAQSEGAGSQAPGHRFVNYWLHGAHLLVEGRKMSKSLGNFFALRDLLRVTATYRPVPRQTPRIGGGGSGRAGSFAGDAVLRRAGRGSQHSGSLGHGVRLGPRDERGPCRRHPQHGPGGGQAGGLGKGGHRFGGRLASRVG
jgi:cysteinyl-tRNA synthetase